VERVKTIETAMTSSWPNCLLSPFYRLPMWLWSRNSI